MDDLSGSGRNGEIVYGLTQLGDVHG